MISEVAAEAKGEVGLSAKKAGDGVDIGAKGGGEAFAGAVGGLAGFLAFPPLAGLPPGCRSWRPPTPFT